MADALAWRRWRELRNATSQACDAGKAEAVAVALAAGEFAQDAHALHQALVKTLQTDAGRG